MLRTAFADLYKLIKKSPFIALVSLLCLLSSFLGILFMQEKLYGDYKRDLSYSTKASVLAVSVPNSKTGAEILASMDKDDNLPPVASLCLSNNKYSGLYYKESDDASLSPIYGRLFSNAEINSADSLVLVGSRYLAESDKQTRDEVLDNGMVLDGVYLKTIGTYNFNWTLEQVNAERDFPYSNFPTSFIVPLTKYMEMHESFSYARYVFKEPLSESQMEYLHNFLAKYNSINIYMFPQKEQGAVKKILANSLPLIFITILSFVNIVIIMMYWLEAAFPRYRVYLLLGSKRSHIMFFVLFKMFVILTLAYAAALLILKTLRGVALDGMVAMLPQNFYLLFYVAAVVLFGFAFYFTSKRKLFTADITDD